jgi:hypothetical protein
VMTVLSSLIAFDPKNRARAAFICIPMEISPWCPVPHSDFANQPNLKRSCLETTAFLLLFERYSACEGRRQRRTR